MNLLWQFRCTDITGVREPKPAVWKWTVGVCYRNEPNSLPSNSSDQQPEASLLREGGPEQDLVSSKGQQRCVRCDVRVEPCTQVLGGAF